MWKVLLLAAVLGAMTVANGADAAIPSQGLTVKEFVHRTYIHGVPYAEASRFGPGDVPVLLDLLASPGEEPYLSHIVVTLAATGDDRAVAPLLKLVEIGGPGKLTPAQYRARTAAVMSLGYVVNRSKNPEALNYLTEGLKTGAWEQRKLAWASPFQESRTELERQLIAMSIMGLALSGEPSARDALLAFQKDSGQIPEFAPWFKRPCAPTSGSAAWG
ncbi:MAG: HEAT repeat domain-containing protein [SAR202 cluster bacterium]|nr:HEAT repeat domain-containing protein [SAR202 cluster bacterium]